jgi:hypothetical protein
MASLEDEAAGFDGKPFGTKERNSVVGHNFVFVPTIDSLLQNQVEVLVALQMSEPVRWLANSTQLLQQEKLQGLNSTQAQTQAQTEESPSGLNSTVAAAAQTVAVTVAVAAQQQPKESQVAM